VRGVYFAAAILIALLDGDAALFAQQLPKRLEELRAALAQLAPFVGAHLENQLHSHSPELAHAREPELEAPGQGQES
jgi:hypothetical protein